MILLFDPLWRGPFWGTLLMSIVTALVGVLVFVKKRSLIGETLSHACYPGVMLAVAFVGALALEGEENWLLAVFAGALIASLLALALMRWLQERFKISSDVTLCLILSSFFGVGVLLASIIQGSFALHYQQMQLYLFGQSATMTDLHIWIYLGLTVFVIIIVGLFFKPLELFLFDKDYAASLGLPVKILGWIIDVVLVAAIVIGMRCAGLVLVSAMLIAPALSARQWTHSLLKLFIFATLFGLIAGGIGNLFSLHLAEALSLQLPTGPTIVIVAGLLALLSLFFAPQQGIVMRWWRIHLFRRRCLEENLLKALWKSPTPLSMRHLYSLHAMNRLQLRELLRRMCRKGYVTCLGQGLFSLTLQGTKEAKRIVRLHRLWEMYLVQDLGVHKERVHVSAEEVEHLLTPELEKEIDRLLDYPLNDPHRQPIPKREA